MLNPYFNFTLPPQQIIQVNGKSSVDSIQMSPNSSVLLMDTSAPIVWMCVSDGLGKVSATPYDIALHEEQKPEDVTSQRLDTIEKSLAILMEKLNDESNVTKSKAKQNLSGKADG